MLIKTLSRMEVDLRRECKKTGEPLAPWEPETVRRAANFHLRDMDCHDVRFVEVEAVPDTLHARFSAKERVYKYLLRAGGAGEAGVLERGRVWHVGTKLLDQEAMQQAASLLQGHHDFSSFRATRCQAKSPYKTLYELRGIYST